ncbi:MAG TPA: phenylalanine--tRNA ligase subunit beta [Pyrinomonadaceae bacterium]|nr:phenylalanine--tRNA ligase subunit beta [Pyrinomonadaceae bacterium]HMP65769.1 phenylalanine--tRNA ligase subunit beta [Pyrinomonadaceae bacterium]
MNISYNWLKELIELDLSPEETAKALTRVGLAVEGIHPHKDDFIFDIDLTSNRPDCLSHLGVARELGVVTGRALSAEADSAPDIDDSEPDPEAVPFPAVLAPEVVRIEAPELCHRFTARIIRGVKIGPSPKWLMDRLEAVGERSINNVADITNYAMLELGQPMHAFDLDKLAEKRIVVRTARAGEKITTLDEAERELDETMLAICDAERPVAVAGVMGGFASGITEETTNVLLEVAFFRRENIRQTSRTLRLATEASYRFERGVDIENLIRASDRATELILELAGGEAADIVDVYPERQPERTVRSTDISVAVKRLTGLEVAADECERILAALGIVHLGGGEYTSPTWRHDIAIEEDLVEEVARHAGYENITDELPPAYGAGEYQPTEQRKRSLRHTLSVLGFDEAITYSFVDTSHDMVFTPVPGLIDASVESPLVELRASVIEGATRMRPSLVPGLLDAVRLNFNHQRKDLKLFEIGKVFASSGTPGGLPVEKEIFALAVTGGVVLAESSAATRPLDFYDAKGSLEAALDSAGIPVPSFTAADIGHLHPGQCSKVFVNGRSVGTIGRLKAEIASDYKFKQAVYVAEIDLQTLLAEPARQAVYSPLPKYPSVIRDVSLLVTGQIMYDAVSSFIRENGGPHCRSVRYVDLYKGEGLEPDQGSLTIRIEFLSESGTLTDAEIDEAMAQILDSLHKAMNIRPRI